MNRFFACALLLAFGVVGGCKDDEPAAVKTPGTLSVNLATPNSGQDGGAVVQISGPVAPRSVTAASGLTLWGGPVTTPQSTIALTGVLSSGTILMIEVEDVTLASQYSATLREVSNTDATVALRVLTGYSLSVVR